MANKKKTVKPKVKKEKGLRARLHMAPVSALAEIVGSAPKAKAQLAELGISTFGGFFDERLLAATAAEPKFLQNRRKAWSLSHLTGLGAIKYLLDPLKIDMVQHHYNGVNRLMLQGPAPKNKRILVKVYTKGLLSSQTTTKFQIRNFLRDDAPSHYLLMCFEGPQAWVVTSRSLRQHWDSLHVSTDLVDAQGYGIPIGYEDHEGGCLNVYLGNENDSRCLTIAAKLGL